MFLFYRLCGDRFRWDVLIQIALRPVFIVIKSIWNALSRYNIRHTYVYFVDCTYTYYPPFIPCVHQSAAHLFRSSTMPELVPSHSHAALTKSRTFDEGDKVSESGTYTIDDDNKELQQAREDIDKLFGVSGGTLDTTAVNTQLIANV